MQIEKMIAMQILHYLLQYEQIKTEISIKQMKYMKVVCFLWDFMTKYYFQDAHSHSTLSIVEKLKQKVIQIMGNMQHHLLTT